MPAYNVTIPCTVSITVTVEAENAEAAKQAALDVPFVIDVKGEGDPEIIAFETHLKITDGNVFYGVLNEMEVDEA